MAGDGNMLYLLFGTLVGVVLGLNIALLFSTSALWEVREK